MGRFHLKFSFALSLSLGLATTAFLPAVTPVAFAQTDTARLTGSVLDATGAAIPSATVTVKNTATGFTRSGQTTGAGAYSFPGLPIGTYTVTAVAAGFGDFTTNVELTVGQQATLNAQLGAASTQVVTAQASAGEAAVNLTDSQVSTTITPREMVDLPSLTRDPYDFTVLAGTANSDPNGSTARGVGVAFNGQRAAGTEILLDGVENADTYSAGVGQTIPLDSVQELSVITNGFDAQYGRASGGVVNLATKSGTNKFHGSAYEFNRISDLASNTFYEDASHLPKDHFVENQFGYSVGGPIRRDKLFFFNNYEWNRVRSSGQQSFYIPSAAFLATASPNTQAFFAQYGKLAPGVTLGAVAANNFQLASVVAPINAGAGSPVNALFGDSRVDYVLSNKISMFVRAATLKQTYTPGYTSLSPYAGFDTGETDTDQSYLFSLNYAITPNLLSSSKVSYARLSTQQPLGTAGVAPGLFLTKNGGTFGSIPVALPGYGPTSPGNALPFGGPQNLYQFVQDFSFTRGRHTLKAGGQFIQLRDNRTFGAYEEASELISATSSTTTGLAMLQSGTVGSFEVAVNPQGKLPCAYAPSGVLTTNAACSIALPAAAPSFTRENTFNDGDAYAEDQFKLTPRLILTLGLRWEYYGVQHNTNPNLESNFYLGAGSNLAQQVQTGQVATTPNSPVGGLIAKDNNNYAPRFSFAYDVFGNGKTAVRGGYGISYERDFGNVTYNVIQNPPNYAGVVVSNTPLTNSNFGPFGGASGTVALAPPSLRAVAQHLPTASTQMFSLTVDQQLTPTQELSVTYSGALGRHLYAIANVNDYGMGTLVGYNVGTAFAMNAPAGCYFNGPQNYCNGRINPQYGAINLREANAYSNYNAALVSYKISSLQRLGLNFTVNYTYGHALDNLSSTFSESTANDNLGYTNAYNPRLDYGNADFDIRHVLTVGGIYQPTFLEFKSKPVYHALFGGLEFAPIATVRSGNKFTIYDCTNGFTTCPRIVETPGLKFHGTAPAQQGFDTTPNDFTYIQLPVAATNPFVNSEGISEFPNVLGGSQNIGMDRNQFTSPMNVRFDAGVYKNFAFGASDRFKLQLRGEFYNVLNHHNFYAITALGAADYANVYGNLVSNGNVGVSKGSPAGSPGSGDERRNVQLAARLQF